MCDMIIVTRSTKNVRGGLHWVANVLLGTKWVCGCCIKSVWLEKVGLEVDE